MRVCAGSLGAAASGRRACLHAPKRRPSDIPRRTMSMPLRPFALVPAFLLGLLLPATPVFAAADTARATERCEHEVAENLRRLRGRDAKEVQFLAARRAHAAERRRNRDPRRGRHRAAGGASVSSATAAPTAQPATAPPAWCCAKPAVNAAAAEKSFDPISPTSRRRPARNAAAEALKKLHIRVARINFGSSSRRLQPAGARARGDDGRRLSGARAGMNLIPFSYRCEVECSGLPRDNDQHQGIAALALS